MLVRHLLLLGCAATCLFAATNVPGSVPSASLLARLNEAASLKAEQDKAVALQKVYLEILNCPSDDTDRESVPTSYVICAGVRDSASDPLLNGGLVAPTDTVVFPESGTDAGPSPSP
jgi:hypothetical protein